jgi:hypothetical protein
MPKIDFKKSQKDFYLPSAKEISVVDVPAMNFLMIDGQGDPAKAKEYGEAIEALFGTAYTLKFMIKKSGGPDYAVPPFESLWWADDMNVFMNGKRDEWKWTAMIRQPDFVTKAQVKQALELVKEKKDPVALPKMRFESFREGPSVQLMHIGPFSAEGPNILRLHDRIKADGHRLKGKHHEIYLNDFRKTDPKKLKTVIRQPFVS